MIDPCASSTARDTMFSEAISSISCRWRPSSFRMAPKISGSISSSGVVKKRAWHSGRRMPATLSPRCSDAEWRALTHASAPSRSPSEFCWRLCGIGTNAATLAPQTASLISEKLAATQRSAPEAPENRPSVLSGRDGPRSYDAARRRQRCRNGRSCRRTSMAYRGLCGRRPASPARHDLRAAAVD